jgi:2-polyprenyl-6-methoxyphenol hydroxylase-like FAD-dependent oxidoreductase
VVEHALVLGGGVAGLAAAAALRGHVGMVTLVERDQLPDRPLPRAGVPQARHVHTLLLRGIVELDALAPGVVHALEAAGALRLDWTVQRIHTAFGWWPRHESGLVGLFCSRDLLEHELRRMVLSAPGVQVHVGEEVVGLVGDAQRVTGVRLRTRGSRVSHELSADLVVDASGRTSDAPRWLAELGLFVPREEVVTSHLGYASRTVAMPEGFDEPWRLLAVRSRRPATRSGVLYPIEHGRWAVTLGGNGEQMPPHDEEGFQAFADALPGGLGALLRAAEPLTHIAAYRRTQNRWRHWERSPAWPSGLLVIGDAACCFNPIYGQGMSVALMQARRVRDAAGAGVLTPSGTPRLQRAVVDVVSDPWALATGEDFRYEATLGHRTGAMRLSHWYADQVLAASVHDVVVQRRFLEVVQLLRPQRALLAPSVVARLPRSARRREVDADAATAATRAR